MGVFFQVEVDVLVKFVTTLTQANGQLEGLPKLMSGVDTDLGNEKLNSAAADFQKSWAYGAGKLATAVTETSGAVTDATRAYQGADQAVHDAVRSLGEPLQMLGTAADQLLKNGSAIGPMK